VLRNNRLSPFEAGLMQAPANLLSGRIAKEISGESAREEVIHPPLVDPHMWVEANDHDAATATKQSPSLSDETSLVWEMMKRVDADDPVERSVADGKLMGRALEKTGHRVDGARATEHAPREI
jgi:hypothetical protein